jgi:hypothetical protein
VNSAKLRKDLSHLGSYGTRGVGYDIAPLIGQIEYILGLTSRRAVALVGVGNLGHALAGYAGFTSRGFRIAALFDADPARVGEYVNGLVIRHVSEIPVVVKAESISIACWPPRPAAQAVADQLARQRHQHPQLRAVRASVGSSRRAQVDLLSSCKSCPSTSTVICSGQRRGAHMNLIVVGARTARPIHVLERLSRVEGPGSFLGDRSRSRRPHHVQPTDVTPPSAFRGLTRIGDLLPPRPARGRSPARLTSTTGDAVPAVPRRGRARVRRGQTADPWPAARAYQRASEADAVGECCTS